MTLILKQIGVGRAGDSRTGMKVVRNKLKWVGTWYHYQTIIFFFVFVFYMGCHSINKLDKMCTKLYMHYSYMCLENVRRSSQVAPTLKVFIITIHKSQYTKILVQKA